ncbi:MAG: hypothetical protein AAF620_14215 [Bacteroidota bacterium]
MNKMLEDNIGFADAIGDSFIEFGKRVKLLTKDCKTRLELYDQLKVPEEEFYILSIENLPQLMGKMMFEDDVIEGKV